MGRIGCAALIAIAQIGLVGSAAFGEVTSLDSVPHGAHVAIRGPVSLSGSTPFSIAEIPAGDYRMTAGGPGLPVVRGRFACSKEGIVGREWSGASALLFPPGVVHATRGERRGMIFLSAGSGSATMSLLSESTVRQAQRQRDKALSAYRSAVSEADILDARLALDSADQKLKDYKEVRNLWLGYLAYTWIGSSVENLLLTPQPTYVASSQGEYVLKLPRAGPWQAAMRSILVPGAGQRYMGHDGRAGLFTAATAALGAGAILAHEGFLNARRAQAEAQSRYTNAETEDEMIQARGALQKAADRTDKRNLLQWSLAGSAAGVYLWNIVDAAGLGREAKSSAVELSLVPSSGGVLLGATWSFQ